MFLTSPMPASHRNDMSARFKVLAAAVAVAGVACSHDIAAPLGGPGVYVLQNLSGATVPCFVDSVGLNSATSAADWVFSDIITLRADSTWSEIELDSLFTPAGDR